MSKAENEVVMLLGIWSVPQMCSGGGVESGMRVWWRTQGRGARQGGGQERPDYASIGDEGAG